ncbi:MAG: malto-oligosyltrehalose synthase [Vicinamibacterales bacterium]
MAPGLQPEGLVPREPRIPVATYRLQFNASFRFDDATAITGYLDSLGVSDAYASSYLMATPGSTHGYDVADPTRLNPEVGGEDEYRAWIAALQARGMGHILDLVPNHMGIAGSANPWWMDVLENGPASRYATFFDITWRPLKDELADKVLIPTLGGQYGAVLERRELTLAYRDGSFVVRYFDTWFPIAPDTYGRLLSPALEAWLADAGAGGPGEADADELRSIITAAEHLPPRTHIDAELIAVRAREKEIVKRRLAQLVSARPALEACIASALARLNGRDGDPRGFDALDALLAEQSYRLAHWRTASEEINYRRFFDVNQLAALRIEDPAVFDEVHRFVFSLVDSGAATGLRVDHVDGLFAPGDYLRRLQARAAADGELPPDGRPLYVVVEKILGSDERLLSSWPVHGTTGYEFAAVVTGLFVDRRNARAFDLFYQRFTGVRQLASFDDLAYASKKRVMHETMSGDINMLGYQLNRFSERNRHFRDFTLYSLISAIKEVIACFPVYRTYITDEGPLTTHDREYVRRAMASAVRAASALEGPVFDFLQRILLEPASALDGDEPAERLAFIGKFQQLTSPVAAKGIEDTVLYVYNRLLALNEVGADPTVFGLEPRDVHRWMEERQQRWPHALSATGTHDTKRGEDVRARLAVLSEMPSAWATAVRSWRARNRRLKSFVRGRPVPDANEEYFLYQMLVGAWPLDDAEVPAFRTRFERYVVKALREAKVNTSWLTPDEDYEARVLTFVRAVLDPGRPFLRRFLPWLGPVAEAGMLNALSQLLVKITAPGIPDFYQGTELWDFAMVDPDNRRTVDYARRAELLASLPSPSPASASALLAARRDGRVKLYTMQCALAARRTQRTTFEQGAYVPLDVTGAHASHIFAFARCHPGGIAIVCIPRLVTLLQGPVWGGPATWADTVVWLPGDFSRFALVDAFTGQPVHPATGADAPGLRVADLFAHFPVALLTGAERYR